MSVLKAVWRGIKRLLEAVGHVVSTILLTAIYIVVVGPLSLILRITGREPLRVSSAEDTTWQDYPEDQSSIDRAHQPF